MGKVAREAKALDRDHNGYGLALDAAGENPAIDLGLSVTIYYRNTRGDMIEMGVSEAAPTASAETEFGKAMPVRQSFSLQLDGVSSCQTGDPRSHGPEVSIMPKTH